MIEHDFSWRHEFYRNCRFNQNTLPWSLLVINRCVFLVLIFITFRSVSQKRFCWCLWISLPASVLTLDCWLEWLDFYEYSRVSNTFSVWLIKSCLLTVIVILIYISILLFCTFNSEWWPKMTKLNAQIYL